MLSSTRGALYRIAAANRLTEMVLPTGGAYGRRGGINGRAAEEGMNCSSKQEHLRATQNNSEQLF